MTPLETIKQIEKLQDQQVELLTKWELKEKELEAHRNNQLLKLGLMPIDDEYFDKEQELTIEIHKTKLQYYYNIVRINTLVKL